MTERPPLMPFERPLLPSIRPTWQEVLLLMAAMVTLLGVFALRSGSDLALPHLEVTPAQSPRLPILIDPLLRQDATPVTRPLASLVLQAIQPSANVPATSGIDVARQVRVERQEFAHLLAQVNVLLIAVIMLGTFVWLKVLLRGRNPLVPGAAALLIAVSPYHSGLIYSAMLTSELLALAFIIVALVFYAMDPFDYPHLYLAVAPLTWVMSLLALLCSEFALPLLAIFVLCDAQLAEGRRSFRRLAQERMLSFYVPLGILTLLWLGLLRDASMPWDMVGAAATKQLQLLANPLDAYDFFAVGRRPASLPPGFLYPIVLAMALMAAWRLRATRWRTPTILLLGVLVSTGPAFLPHQAGQPFFSHAFNAIPAWYLMVLLAALLCAFIQPSPRPTGATPGAVAAAPAARYWTPEQQSALAVVFLVLAVLTSMRLVAAADADRFFRNAGKAHRELPELLHTASTIQLERIAQVPEGPSRREAIDLSTVMLRDSLNQFLDLRRQGFEGTINIPASSFEHRANMLIRQNRLADAIPLIEEALAANKSNDLRYKLASLLMMDGDRERAAEEFREALEADPRGLNALRLADAAIAARDFALAEVYLQALDESGRFRGNDLYRILRALGQTRINAGRPAEALPTLERARELGDPDGSASRLYLQALAQAGEIERLVRMHREIRRSPTAPTDLQPVGLFIAPILEQIVARNDVPAGFALMNAWVEASESGPERATALLNRGQFNEAAGRTLDALQDYRRATEIAPNFGEAYIALADYYIRREFPRDALSTLRRAHELLPDNTDVLTVLVNQLIAQQQREEAVRILTAVVERQRPKRFEPVMLLANLYIEQGLTETATNLLLEARGLAGDDREKVKAVATSLARTPAFERGAEMVVQLTQRDPQNPELYLLLVDIFQRGGDLESARVALAHGINACRPDARLFAKGGELALLGRNLQVAARSFQRALELDANNELAQQGMRTVEEIQRRMQERADILRAAQPTPEAEQEAEPDPETVVGAPLQEATPE